MRFAAFFITALFVMSALLIQTACAEEKIDPALNARLDKVSEMIDAGELDPAIAEIDKILVDNPTQPRALKLYLRANKMKADAEKKANEVKRKVDDQRAMSDVDKAAEIPKKEITNEPPIKFPKRAKSALSQEMQELLNQRVELNVIDTDLSYIFQLLSATHGINIVADRSLLVDKRLDVHVANVRLVDLLDYICLNSGIEYTVNDSGIWISTPLTPQLDIRIFHLRIGVTRTGKALQTNDSVNQASSISGTGTNNNNTFNNNNNSNTNRNYYNPYNYRRVYKDAADAAQDVADSYKADGAPGGFNFGGGGGDNAFRAQMLQGFANAMAQRAGQTQGTQPTNGTNGTNAANAANNQAAKDKMTDMELMLDWVTGWSGNLQWPTGSTWRFDAKTNSLIVVSTGEMLDRVEKIIDEFDVAPIQVNIRTRFITVKIEDGMQWGIQALLDSALGEGGDGTNKRTQFDPGSGFNLGVPSGGNTQGATLTFRGVLTDPQYRIVMNALQTKLNGRLLSEPNVTTLSNEPARLVVAEQYPYPDNWEPVQSTTTSDGSVSTATTAYVPTDFQTENVGITLDVMPSVGSDVETIMLELHPQIVNHDPNKDAKYNIISTNSAGQATSFEVTRPVFARQEVVAKVVLRSGETVVLGGLIDEEDVTTKTQVPILGDIPGLGLLFKKTVKSKSRSNLLIFVTAEIVDTKGRFYHPKDGTNGTNGRDLMPTFNPTANPVGANDPNTTGGGSGSASSISGTDSPSKADTSTARADGEKSDRPTFKIDRPKPPRIGRSR
ncbi:MAG: hypothetical protein WC712_03200 [Candidatus Brocadiia bacterium]